MGNSNTGVIILIFVLFLAGAGFFVYSNNLAPVPEPEPEEEEEEAEQEQKSEKTTQDRMNEVCQLFFNDKKAKYNEELMNCTDKEGNAFTKNDTIRFGGKQSNSEENKESGVSKYQYMRAYNNDDLKIKWFHLKETMENDMQYLCELIYGEDDSGEWKYGRAKKDLEKNLLEGCYQVKPDVEPDRQHLDVDRFQYRLKKGGESGYKNQPIKKWGAGSDWSDTNIKKDSIKFKDLKKILFD